MEITIPIALKTLSAAGAAAESITAWWKRSKGNSRALISELKDNLLYLDMVAVDHVPLGDIIDKLSMDEYRRLSREGFSFNRLKKGKVSNYPSLQGTDLERMIGKETEDLIVSIYEKINELRIKYPYVAKNKKYRWGVRVNNIRKRIWLLVRHVSS
jgi:hypothetical protein